MPFRSFPLYNLIYLSRSHQPPLFFYSNKRYYHEILQSANSPILLIIFKRTTYARIRLVFTLMVNINFFYLVPWERYKCRAVTFMGSTRSTSIKMRNLHKILCLWHGVTQLSGKRFASGNTERLMNVS